jgi:hypothetical protein
VVASFFIFDTTHSNTAMRFTRIRLIWLTWFAATADELSKERTLLEGDDDTFLANDAVSTQQYFSRELKVVKEDFAFGLVSSADAFTVRVRMLRLW